MQLPKRRLSEFLTIYHFEPDLRDLYLEGVQDTLLYDWFLQQTLAQDVAVYSIDSIEISSDVLRRHKLRNGNRSRVIALSLELDREFPCPLSRVRCVADSDFDFVLGCVHKSNHLLYTNVTSWELYLYEADVIEKILSIGYRIRHSDFSLLFDSMSVALTDMFLIRASNQLLRWGMHILSMLRWCSTDGMRISFDRESFVNQCLINNSRSSSRDEFDRTLLSLRKPAASDPRQSIHKKDLSELLDWYIRTRARRSHSSAGGGALQNMIAALDVGRLSREQLFDSLLTAYS